MAQIKDDVIDEFGGEYFGFLNNEFPSLIFFSEAFFPSVNAAFQAARSDSQDIREKISMVNTPDEVWEIAEQIEDPEDWPERRVKVMEQLLRDKFRRNKELKERLKETSGRSLINTLLESTPSNLYWGIVNGEGENKLGNILEQIRQDIIDNIDLDKWLMYHVKLEFDKTLLPTIHLNVMKEGKQIEQVKLIKKNSYFLGQLKKNDLILAHPSISRTHACIACDEEQNIFIIDLGSKGGTFVDDVQLEEFQPCKIGFNNTLKFAVSTRTYIVDIDFQHVMINLQKQEKQLKKELIVLEKIDNPDISQDDLRKVLGFTVDNTIYVGNLPFTADKRDLKELFGQFGEIKDIKIPLNRNRQTKGIAFITYANETVAQKAILRGQGQDMEGRKLKISKCDKLKLAEFLEDVDMEQRKSHRKKDRRSRSRSRSRNRDKKSKHDKKDKKSKKHKYDR